MGPRPANRYKIADAAGRAALLLIALARSLVGQTLGVSEASVDLMYSSAHAKDLAFLQNRDDLYQAVRDGELEMISVTNDLALDEAKYPFVLPNTKRFADR